MEQTSVNKQQRRLLIGGRRDPQITSLELSCLTKGFNTVDLRALGLLRVLQVRRHVWQIPLCSPPSPLLSVAPFWVPKCSSRATLCIVHGQHTSGAAIVAVHSRGTFSHWDTWEHEPKLRSVFSVFDEARTVPTWNFPFIDRLFALPLPAMLAAVLFQLAQNKPGAGLPPSTVSFVLCFPFKNAAEATPLWPFSSPLPPCGSRNKSSQGLLSRLCCCAQFFLIDKGVFFLRRMSHKSNLHRAQRTANPQQYTCHVWQEDWINFLREFWWIDADSSL